jgi:AraC-like DNA-binding protein
MPVRASDDLLRHLCRARDHADRHYDQPLDLEQLAAVAGISKYHFQRLFTATYGMSPAEHLSRRRVERAQDLLRATNLTVTEVCMTVGFTSLGSFSTRFRELVGVSPSEFRRRYSDGAPRIPGCYLFMAGLAERYPPADAGSASEEKPGGCGPP